MDFDIPNNFQLLYSREQIAEVIDTMGKDITKWSQKVWEESHTDVIAIPVLRGGIFFFADLVREIKYSAEIAPARTWGYQTDVNNVQSTELKVDINNVPAKGRSILLIDDICDSGRTLRLLKEALLEAGAIEVRSATLIKRIMKQETFDPEWVGFEYTGTEWFVGYGMEDCERWRNLPNIYVIKQG